MASNDPAKKSIDLFLVGWGKQQNVSGVVVKPGIGDKSVELRKAKCAMEVGAPGEGGQPKQHQLLHSWVTRDHTTM